MEWWQRSSRSNKKGCKGLLIKNKINPPKSWHNYVIHYRSNKWSLLRPECCTGESSLAIINGSLTTIGGLYNSEACSHLYSLCDYQWIQRFPDMQVRCTKPTTLCIQESQLLIVAGGFDKSGAPLKRMDVLRTNHLNSDCHSAWNRVADLPVPLSCASATLCNDHIILCILGGNTDIAHLHDISVYHCTH